MLDCSLKYSTYQEQGKMEILNMPNTAVSLFTGAGGLDIGFGKAGFKTIWANDINADACATFELNHGPDIIRCGEVKGFISEIKKITPPDVLIGGPPCQGFSVAGYMDMNDPRSELVFTYMNVLRLLKPKAFVLENVKALATLAKFRPIRERLLREARAAGYNVQLIVLRASDFGVPQARERMLIVGFQNHRALDFVEYLETQRKTAPKLREAIAHLGRAGSSTNPHICNAKITIAKRPVMRASPYAGMLFNGQGRPLDPDGYASTLPASMGGNRTPIVDEEHLYGDGVSWVADYHAKLMDGGKPLTGNTVPSRLRRLTLDEASSIQTFPTGYRFVGRKSSIYAQIGNAVPCELGRRVGVAIRAVLNGYRSNTVSDVARLVA
jgi:DNA (cytosine-5)-methyltransferase 1